MPRNSEKLFRIYFTLQAVLSAMQTATSKSESWLKYLNTLLTLVHIKSILKILKVHIISTKDVAKTRIRITVVTNTDSQLWYNLILISNSSQSSIETYSYLNFLFILCLKLNFVLFNYLFESGVQSIYNCLTFKASVLSLLPLLMLHSHNIYFQ